MDILSQEENNSINNKDMFKKLFVGTIVALILLGVGVFIGTKIPRKIATSSGGQSDSFQAGWDAAKERLKQSSLGMAFPIGMEIKSISGTIQKIDGNKLMVKINPLEPLADPSLDTRTITVDANTKITVTVQKDQAEYQREMQAFQDKMRQPQQQQADSSQVSAPAIPPMPFDKKDISISDLKENQQITATAGEDVKERKDFTAVEIDAQEASAGVSPSALTLPIAPSVSAVQSAAPAIPVP